MVPPAEILAATPSSVDKKKVGKDLVGSEPSTWRQSNKKKKKEPIPELELEEESIAKDMGSSEDADSEEEEEPTILPLEKKKGSET